MGPPGRQEAWPSGESQFVVVDRWPKGSYNAIRVWGEVGLPDFSFPQT